MQDRRPEASLLMHLDWHPRTQINHETINRLLKCIDDPSARSPNRFFYEMRLGIKWMVVSKNIVDVGETISLDAQSL